MIVIVDSGGANLVSITSALLRLGYDAIISSSIQEIQQATHIILPGVGSATTVMNRLNKLGLVDVLKTVTQPLLGICVGMQILFEFSEEGLTTCLGIVKGVVKRLPVNEQLCLPHMGWNTVKICAFSPMMNDIPEQAYMYFVHNFAAPISSDTIAETNYGISFSAAIQHRNFMGVQFHPERSGMLGTQLLKNFLGQE